MTGLSLTQVPGQIQRFDAFLSPFRIAHNTAPTRLRRIRLFPKQKVSFRRHHCALNDEVKSAVKDARNCMVTD